MSKARRDDQRGEMEWRREAEMLRSQGRMGSAAIVEMERSISRAEEERSAKGLVFGEGWSMRRQAG